MKFDPFLVHVCLQVCLFIQFAFSCTDNSGIERKPGEEWIEQNSFVLSCQYSPSGQSKIVFLACLLPDGSRIKANSTKVALGVKHECTVQAGRCRLRSIDQEGVASFSSNIALPSPEIEISWSLSAPSTTKCIDVNGIERAVGETWVFEKMFVMTCVAKTRNGWKVHAIACLSKKGIRIAIGSVLVELPHKYACKKTTGSTSLIIYTFPGKGAISLPRNQSFHVAAEPLPRNFNQFQSSTTTASTTSTVSMRLKQCIVNGKHLAVNSEYEYLGKFIMRCTEKGAGEVIACLTPVHKRRIIVNGSLVEGDKKYKCEKTPTGVSLNSTHITRPSNPVDLPEITKCSIGEEIVEMQPNVGGFLKQCVAYGKQMTMKITACITSQGVEVPVGHTVQIGKDIYLCQKNDRWNQASLNIFGLPSQILQTQLPIVNATGFPAATPLGWNMQNFWWLTNCYYGGRRFKNHEEWCAGDFYMKCSINTNGTAGSIAVTPVACATPNGTRIEPGKNATEGSKWYGCAWDDAGRLRLQIETLSVGAGSMELNISLHFQNSVVNSSQKVWKTEEDRNKNFTCSISCSYNGRNLCNGQEGHHKSFPDGDVMFVCANKTVDWYCIVKLPSGLQYKLFKGEYFILNSRKSNPRRLFACAVFDDSHNQLEPTVQYFSPQILEILETAGYKKVDALPYSN